MRNKALGPESSWSGKSVALDTVVDDWTAFHLNANMSICMNTLVGSRRLGFGLSIAITFYRPCSAVLVLFKEFED
jgi:hypothetical protein